MTFDEELGARLRKIRQQRNLSQEYLGQRLGVTFQQIQKYESGTSRMPPEKLDKCTEIFDVPVGYFFGSLLNHGADIEAKSLEIARAIASLPSAHIRQHIYQIVMALHRTAA